ncbi:DNA translocase FtsK 4TM domain-containing protein [Vibrio sp. S4M6]|uniref:DNA translocase FtsK n=1 Tax=Vibrio sinus TaxID=2946865 RepID=UPI00202A9CF3|nr:DNA translocase FtsK 4TM domain-containing protein [Vibrio sinus]MCL9782283.1 DNA translocase FtsK 4TM domain-containing protein [Vibrio sinus]
MFKESKNKIETTIKTGEAPRPFRLNGSQRLKECGLILAVLISMLLLVALLTFSPADPSWSQTAWGMHIKNAGGFVGAYVADTLFFTFGVLAYLVPFLLIISSWVYYRKKDSGEPIDFMLWGTRVLGLVIIVLTSCGLANINANDIWYFSSGGVIGDVLTNLALPTLNVLGSTLVFLFLWGAGFTLLTGISWLRVVEWLGEKAIGGLTSLVNRTRGEQDELIEPIHNIGVAKDDWLENSNQQNSLPEEPALEERQAVDPLMESTSSAGTSKRKFNIHVPEASKQERKESVPNFLKTGTDSAPDEFAVEVVSQEVDLGKQNLTATIEELERAAAVQENLAVVDPLNNEELSSIHQDLESQITPQEPVVIEETPWNIENDAEQPAFDDTQLDQIEPDDKHIEPVISSFDIEEEPLEIGSSETDADVQAFQDMVSEAKNAVKEKQNPFLMQKEADLPVPEEPMPTLELLYHPEKRENFIDREALENIARLVEAKLADYKIHAEVVDIFPGPVITRFELDLAPGVKVSRISSLSMDLARSLSAMAVRVVEVIPGKPYVGLELPNMSRQTVYFSDVVGSPQFEDAKSPTTVVLGQDIAGDAVVADLAKMPHVLVAGTTGSGKSVGVNVMILSMLYKATPEEVRFIMIDPKMLELSVYEGIPHLLSEVVTDMKDASNALRWCVGEMERRYKLMSALGVRNIKGFNDKLKMAAEAGHPIHDPLWQEGDSMDQEAPLLTNLPYIVVIVDEFADLMMVVGKKVEELIARLAQKARAAGIHLILATQRPSVDVITGLIKANIPTRVAFTVSTKTDSRTILDQGGAESLLGMGDMLYLPPGSSHTVRVHGAFASDDDVHAVVNNWKARGKPEYVDGITSGDQSPETLLPGEKMETEEEMDPLFDQVVEHVVETRRGSVSGVQRRFKIGYNRAARIVEQLEMQGIVSAPGHNGNREVLAPAPGRDMN